MKTKLKILSLTFFLLMGIILLASGQKVPWTFTQSNNRELIYMFPAGKMLSVSNTQDTARYCIGKDLITEYKGQIFLNGKYKGKAAKKDTVILNRKSEIEIRHKADSLGQ